MNTENPMTTINLPEPDAKYLVVYVGAHDRVIAIAVDHEKALPISDPYTTYTMPLDADVQIGQPLEGKPYVRPGAAFLPT